MTRFVSPPLDELDSLPTKLEPGEREVLDVFLEHLSEEWEIYIQPHLNGLRPDFVLLHPQHGIAVYEVKDWNLGAMRYFFQGSPPTLRASRDGKVFSRQRDNPIEKAKTYKQEIHELYCPSLPVAGGFGVITAGVLFPKASQAQLTDLFGGVYEKELRYPQNVLAGREAISAGRLVDIFPLVRRRNNRMSPEVAAELRSWLREPEISAEQRQPLEMDKSQRDLATSRTKSGYRRIKGPAGSGKSLILAARAAELAKEGKRVLVVTFNITLINYLRDLAVRWERKGVRKNVTWLNYHAWCKRVCWSTGRAADYASLWATCSATHVCEESLPDLVDQILSTDDSHEFDLEYDAVLVDEGQDFRLNWWNTLRKACHNDGEMLLVADPTQDLYGTARAWTDDAMKGAGFPGGRWTTLKTSYRLPADYLPRVRDFAERYLPDDDFRALPDPPQTLLPLAPTMMRWAQVEDARVVDACVTEIMTLPARAGTRELAWADVVFLTATKKTGHAVVTKLAEHNIKVLHTFYSDEEERRRKLAFYKGDARVKATTLHSFKGWEGRALVIHLSDLNDDAMLAAAYAALTRLKRHPAGAVISVVCSWGGCEQYGQTWPDFHKAGQHSYDLASLPEFDDEWISLMAALADEAGVLVEPGEEVMHAGRVVDLDLATVRKGDETVRLVDASQPSATEVAAVLEKQGHKVLQLRAHERGLLERVLSEVGA